MGYALELMKMGKNDEWYTPRHAVEIILPYVPDNATVWCPFDTQSSQYVHVFNGVGKTVIASHIADGKDFFRWEPPQTYDCIISNPPYSMKDEVFARLFQLGKPWAMLVPCNGLFDSKARFSMFSKHGIQILVPDGRTKFISPDGCKTFAPPFQAVYACWKFLPETICFEKKPYQDGNSLWG